LPGRIDLDVHENVKGRRNGIRRNSKWLEMSAQILETTWMIIFVAVNDLKRLAAARREQKIVTSHVVGHDGEHRPAAIGIENVTGSEVNCARVIEAAPGGKPLRFVVAREGDEIGDLFAFEIDHAQQLALQ